MQQSGLQGRVTAGGFEWRAAGAHVQYVPAVTGAGKGSKMDDGAGREDGEGERIKSEEERGRLR